MRASNLGEVVRVFMKFKAIYQYAVKFILFHYGYDNLTYLGTVTKFCSVLGLYIVLSLEGQSCG